MKLIWILYRIEGGIVKAYGYSSDYDSVKKWADAGGYQILESNSL